MGTTAGGITHDQHTWATAFTGVDTKAASAAPGGSAGAKPGNGASPPPGDGASQVAKMDAKWQAAVKAGNWKEAALVVNGFSPADLAAHLKPLSKGDRGKLYQGALDSGIGPNSAVALATKDAAGKAADGHDTVGDMDKKWQAAVKGGDWSAAALAVNGFNEPDMRKRLAPLSADQVAKLHEAAVKNAKLGQNSAVALQTAAIQRPVLNGGQADRAKKLQAKLSPKDQKKLQAVLDAAKAPAEKDYVTKGLAAGHTVAELEKFAKKIAGKDAKWMQDNLSLTGNSEGKGVKQQWSMSCNATTVEAVRAEFDPLYALKMHEDNPHLTEADDDDGKAMNKKLAADQKKMLQSGYKGTLGKMDGGVAKSRDAAGGVGRWADDLLNKSKDMTGVTFKTEIIGDPGGPTLDKAVSEINTSVAKGVPVPIVIGKQGGDSSTAHYVLVTAMDPGPPVYYTIHDPWEGKTYRRSEDQIKKGKIDIAGWNDLGAIEHPTLTK